MELITSQISQLTSEIASLKGRVAAAEARAAMVEELHGRLEDLEPEESFSMPEVEFLHAPTDVEGYPFGPQWNFGLYIGPDTWDPDEVLVYPGFYYWGGQVKMVSRSTVQIEAAGDWIVLDLVNGLLTTRSGYYGGPTAPPNPPGDEPGSSGEGTTFLRALYQFDLVPRAGTEESPVYIPRLVKTGWGPGDVALMAER